jgi:hypothetical protein
LHQLPGGKEAPPMLQPQDGTLYIVVTCEQCQSTIFLFPDLTEGKIFYHSFHGIRFAFRISRYTAGIKIAVRRWEAFGLATVDDTELIRLKW